MGVLFTHWGIVVIEIRVWDTKTAKRLNLCKTIIDDVSICHTHCGYEVLIDLKTRVYDIRSFGSVRGGGQISKESIIFEKDDIWHTVEWEEPKLNLKYIGNMDKFHQVNKAQVIIYFIQSSILYQKGKNIAEWECPSQGIMRTLDKLELDTC